MKAGRKTVALVVLAATAIATAQNYHLDWFTVDGGGGTTTGGVYSVTGTIGQPDAGMTLRGGDYSLEGGFWGVIAAVKAPDRKWLSIARTATNSVIISWPSPSSGWTLHENSDLKPVSWSEVLTTPNDDGTTKSVTIAPPGAKRFYRLQK